MADGALPPYRALWGRLLNRIGAPVVVLAYHRVCRLESDPELLAVTPENFREQMLVLRSSFPVLRFEDEWRVRRPSVVITFDDGYYDNATIALPILEQLGLPATFFVTTSAVENQREFWWDELGGLLLAAPADAGAGSPRDLELPGPGRVRWPTARPEERISLYRELHARLKFADEAGREELLERLRDWAGRPRHTRSSHRPATLEELRRMAASPSATIGAHGVTHTRLGSLDVVRQQEEIAGSKRRLEAWLGREVRVFSYPFGGRRDFNAASVRLAQAAGYRRSAANIPGSARGFSHAHRIPRNLVRDWPGATLARKLADFLLR